MPYAGIIIKICRAYTDSQEDFEDYYQEVCLQIWRSREQFRGDSKWSTWIYRLSLNICLTLIKKKNNNRQHRTTDLSFIENSEDNHAFADESLNLLYAAIKQLSEIDRAVILLYLEEKPYKEIGEICDLNESQVKVYIFRSRKLLKEYLGKVENLI